MHTSRVIQEAWEIDQSITVYYQTIGIQGQHADRIHINFKNTSDGFQAEYLCEDGYTLCFHFQNESPPQQWIGKGFSLLHARVFGLLD